MSAGDFGRFKYECDDGNICPVRLQPETVAADFNGTVNAEPAGAVTMNSYAKVNKTRREYGVRPRYITGNWLTVPAGGYEVGGTVKISVLLKATWDAIPLFSVVAYLGGTVEVTFKEPENIR